MRLRHLALPAAAGLTLLAIPFAPAAVAAEQVCNPEVNSCLVGFDYTGGVQTFQVPAGVTNLLTVAGGASGGDGLAAPIDDAPKGGTGAVLAALVPVTPGETLTLVVGGKGGDAAINDGSTGAAGGYGGGGAGTSGFDGPSGGGGGGTFVFDSTGKLLLAVGGGGGAGFTGTSESSSTGGNGGTSAGTAGGGTNGGGGATAGAGGAAGSGERGAAGSGPATSPTAFGNGGAADACAAGGGGGGYFGGGSGGCTILIEDAKSAAVARTAAAPAAAAAAAAAAPAATTTGGGGGGGGYVGEGVSPVADSGFEANTGNGGVLFGYTTAATTTTLTTNDDTLAPGQEATLSAKVTGPALTIAGGNEDADQTAKAAAIAKAFGSAGVKALAVPSQPAAPGSTVTPSTACGTTPCTVTFFVNGKALTTPITVDPATGVATAVFTAGSDLGVRNITAQYNGNFYYLQSTSNQVTITVAGLANTGVNDIAPMIGTAAGLLVIGAGLLAYGRRRPAFGSHRAA